MKRYSKTGQIDKEVRDLLYNYGKLILLKLESKPCPKDLDQRCKILIKTLRRFLRELEYRRPITITPYFADVAITYIIFLYDVDTPKVYGVSDELRQDTTDVINTLCIHGNINPLRILEAVLKELNKDRPGLEIK